MRRRPTTTKGRLIGDLSLNPNHNPELMHTLRQQSRRRARRDKRAQDAEASEKAFSIQQPALPPTDASTVRSLAALLLFFRRGQPASGDRAPDAHDLPPMVLDALIQALPRPTSSRVVNADSSGAPTGTAVTVKPDGCCCPAFGTGQCASELRIRPGTRRLVVSDATLAQWLCVASHTSLASAALTSVRLVAPPHWDAVQATLAAPAVKTVRRVELCYPDRDPVTVHSLARCLRRPTFLPSLEHLSVVDTGTIDIGALAEAIDARRHATVPVVRSLRLASVDGMQSSGPRCCAQLSRLALDGIRFGAGELAALRECAVPSLTALAVTRCSLTDASVVEVLEAVFAPSAAATNLRELDVSGNLFDGCAGLFGILKSATQLESIDLTTRWDPPAMSALAELIARPGSRLRSLTIRGTPGISGAAQVRRLLVALKRAPAPLSRLRLIDCGLAGTEVRHASNLIAARLALGSGNGIDAETGLHLDLSGSDVDLPTLTATPATFAAITRLTLSRCRFGEGRGGAAARGGLKLLLHPVGAAAPKLIAQGLTRIDLDDAALDVSAVLGLARAAAANRTSGLRLKHVSVCSNVKLAGEVAGKALADLTVACAASIRCVRAQGCRLGAAGVLACLAGLGVPTRADAVTAAAAGQLHGGLLVPVLQGDPDDDDDDDHRFGVHLGGNVATSPDADSTERELIVLHHLRPSLAASPFYCGVRF